MSYRLGVDVGTTFTAAAVGRGGTVEAVALGHRSHVVPTVVYARDDGEFLVGRAAERRAHVSPDRVAREFKRNVGDRIPIRLGERSIAAHELVAEVAAWAVEQVQRVEGAPPSDVVVTVSATWGDHRRALVVDAASARIDQRVTSMVEPVAAAAHYNARHRLADGDVLGVYDLGGGTFDASIVRRVGNTFELVGVPQGDERLGGLDLDQLVVDHVVRSLGSVWSELDPSDESTRRAAARLRQDAADAKEQLSSDTDVLVPVVLRTGAHDVRLTRSEFEEAAHGLLLRSVETLQRAARSAGIAPEEMQRVLLVGGASRIPLVSELIAQYVGVPVAVDAHPKFAVCLGAVTPAEPGTDVTAPTPPAPVRDTPTPPATMPVAPATPPPAADTAPIEPVGPPEPVTEPVAPAREPTEPVRGVAGPAVDVDDPGPSPPPAEPGGENRRRAVVPRAGLVAGAIGLAVVAVAAVWLVPDRDQAEPAPEVTRTTPSTTDTPSGEPTGAIGDPPTREDVVAAVGPLLVREGEEPDFTIVVIGEDGEERPLDLGGLEAPRQPALSPDGDQVAFVATTDGQDRVYVAPLDGSDDPVPITTERETSRPAWSPDGDRIACAMFEAGSSWITVYDVAEQDFEDVTASGEVLDNQPDWSPDGTRLVFGRRLPGEYQVLVVDLASDASEPAVVATNPLPIGGPVWSPDGQRLAYRIGDQSDYGVVVQDAEPNALPVPLAPSIDENHAHPDWTASGIVLLEINGTGGSIREVRAVDPDDGWVVSLGAGAEADARPASGGP